MFRACCHYSIDITCRYLLPGRPVAIQLSIERWLYYLHFILLIPTNIHSRVILNVDIPSWHLDGRLVSIMTDLPDEHIETLAYN